MATIKWQDNISMGLRIILPNVLLFFLLLGTSEAQVLWRYDHQESPLTLEKIEEQNFLLTGNKISNSEWARHWRELVAIIQLEKNDNTLFINGVSILEEDSDAQILAKLWSLLSFEYLSSPLEFLELYNKMEESRLLAPIIETSLANSDTIVAEKLTIVTHASTQFDEKRSIKPGLDALLEKSVKNNHHILFLMNRDGLADVTWMTQMRNPKTVVDTSNGHFDFNLDAREIHMAGGYFSLCFNRSVMALINRNKQKNFSIYMPLNAIYEDKYFFSRKRANPEYWEWMTSVTYPISLQEIIQKIELADLKRGLEMLFSDVRGVSLKIKIKNKIVWQKHSNNRAKKSVTIHFE